MIRNIATVMRGTVLAQGIGVLILPVLTRSFSPVAFGQFQIFQAFVGLTLVVATLRYEIAILRAETPRELGALLTLCVLLNLAIATLLLAGLLVYEAASGTTFALVFGFPFALVVAAFVLGGAVQYLGYFLSREKLFALSSNSKVAQAILNAGTALALALVRPINTGIIIADVVGRGGAALAMVGFSARHLRQHVARPTWADIAAAARRFREYPLVAVPGGLINMASAMLTPIMIYGTFSAATSGQFGLLERSATLPIALISGAISQVYMAQLASDLRVGAADAAYRFRRLLLLLAALSVPPAALIALFAPWLFAIVFGPGWAQAALFAQLMVPAYCLALLSGAINMTLIVAGWQRTQFIWEVARLVAMAALWIGGARLGWPVAAMVAGHSAILACFAAAMMFLSDLAIRTTVRDATGTGGRREASEAQ